MHVSYSLCVSQKVTKGDQDGGLGTHPSGTYFFSEKKKSKSNLFALSCFFILSWMLPYLQERTRLHQRNCIK